MKKLLLLMAAVAAFLPLGAQGPDHNGIPDDMYYLLPSFGDGYVYFLGQPPAQGKLNICALDQSLRFKDKDGKELEASHPEGIVKVLIDTVWFLRSGETFYRMYPVSADMGVALERKVRIVRGEKEIAYGTSQTASVRQYSSIISNGYSYDLSDGKHPPLEVNETICLYKGNSVVPVSKKNLRKLFPARKDDIDAWFKDGNSIPRDVDGVRALLDSWNRP